MFVPTADANRTKTQSPIASGLGIVSSTRRIRTAERWQHIAWGRTNERQRGWCNPRSPKPKNPPRGDLAATPPNRRGENRVGCDNSWGCGLLAETSKPGPRLYAITAPQLSDCCKESECSCLPLTRIAPKLSLALRPKPDSLLVLALRQLPGQVLGLQEN